ncbi:MAG: hypothetical protein ACOX9E_02670, partial [Lentisphaeria bacterium]
GSGDKICHGTNVANTIAHYGMNRKCSGLTDSSYVSPSTTAMIIEANADNDKTATHVIDSHTAVTKSTEADAKANKLFARHSDSTNVTYGDGHVGTVKLSAIPKGDQTDLEGTSATAPASQFWNPRYTGSNF